MATSKGIASLILAAGRGTRMKGYDGNKTLLPLAPGSTPYEGGRPILLHIVDHLPKGPKAVIVHYRKEEVIEATAGYDLTYCEQPRPNGTGGALLAARDFVATVEADSLIVAMGDVPFVSEATYLKLAEELMEMSFVVLGFKPASKKRYGVLEQEGRHTKRIIEWEYWSRLPEREQEALQICNSGIYAARKETLLRFLPVLASNPHAVTKTVEGRAQKVEEYFLTDLVQYMYEDGLAVGCVMAADEDEVMGVDDLEALRKAQELFARDRC